MHVIAAKCGGIAVYLAVSHRDGAMMISNPAANAIVARSIVAGLRRIGDLVVINRARFQLQEATWPANLNSATAASMVGLVVMYGARNQTRSCSVTHKDATAMSPIARTGSIRSACG